MADEPEEYTVRWTGLTWEGRYEVTGPPIPGGWRIYPAFGPVCWTERTYTLWGARRAIRNHKRARKIIYRESA
jgi:hypothetical protein